MFAKTFIGSKTVFLEVEQFNFYVLTENEGSVSVMAGYFSKVKRFFITITLNLFRKSSRQRIIISVVY